MACKLKERQRRLEAWLSEARRYMWQARRLHLIATNTSDERKARLCRMQREAVVCKAHDVLDLIREELGLGER